MAAVVLGAPQSGGRKGVCGRMESVPGTGNGVWNEGMRFIFALTIV